MLPTPIDIHESCNVTIVNKQTAVTINGGVKNDTHLFGFNFLHNPVGTVVITGFLDDAGAACTINYPAGTPKGFYSWFGAINDAGPLTVTCSDASDAKFVTVHWASSGIS